MQTAGYVIISSNPDRDERHKEIKSKIGEKILILVRQASYYRNIKLRKTGKEGVFFDDESFYLSDPDSVSTLAKLREGVVIGI